MARSAIARVGDVHESIGFGKYKIINADKSTSILVEFIDTGYRCKVQSSKIKSGSIKDPLLPNVFGVGFIGGGIHKARVNGKLQESYRCWRAMLQGVTAMLITKRDQAISNAKCARSGRIFRCLLCGTMKTIQTMAGSTI